MPKAPDDLWEQIAAVTTPGPTRPGPEWFTTQEHGNKFSLNYSTSRTRIRVGITAGKLERRKVGHIAYFRVKP